VWTGFNRADAIASLFVAVLMLRSGFKLQRRTMRVLLESAPSEIVPEDVGRTMAQAPHVREVYDLHLWELAPGHPVLTAHVLVERGADCHAIRRALDEMLHQQFNIDHTTLQVEHAHERLLAIERRPQRPQGSD
jgi:cobalt-zinc-cadmium efflux system protein